MPADHGQACRPAIGFVNLLYQCNAPDPFLALPEESSLVGEGVLLIDCGRGFRFRFRLFKIDFIGRACLGWQLFLSKIQWDVCFGVQAVLGPALFHQSGEFWKEAVHFQHRLRRQRQQATVRHGLHGGRSRRLGQDR